MNLPLHSLSEVRAYFDNGDNHVGYRRLLDAAIDTRDPGIYEATLAFCDWYDARQAAVPADRPAGTADQGAGTTNQPALIAQVNDLLDRIGNVPVPVFADPGKPYIRVKNVEKRYNRGTFSLKAIEFDLLPGQIIGLVGENGNGKTTLLRLLFGQLSPDQGTVDYALRELPPHPGFYDIKTRLAFIPQRPNAWYGSLMDNLQFTAAHYGLHGRENYLWTEMICARMGLRPFRTFTWNRISSGYKMRFELARTLIRRPEVLLLDEPLANLDVLAQQVILEDLRFLAQSPRMPLGIILSSQQLYEVEKVSTQVIFLKEGKPKYQRTLSAVTTEPEQLVFELETSASREQLQLLLAPVGLKTISFNGGVYLLYFDAGSTFSRVMTTLGNSGIPVRYLRDISTSSRRFFNA